MLHQWVTEKIPNGKPPDPGGGPAAGPELPFCPTAGDLQKQLASNFEADNSKKSAPTPRPAFGCRDEILETYFRQPSLSQEQINKLLAAGVPNLALAHDPDEYGFAVAAGQVVFDGNGGFEFAEDVQDAVDRCWAFIFVARDEACDVADLVAWRGEQLATWLGRVSLLGQQFLIGPRVSVCLEVHADPIAWLCADRHGVVVIDEDRARWPLSNAGPLLVSSIEQGRKLRSALTTFPEILIPESVERTAL